MIASRLAAPALLLLAVLALAPPASAGDRPRILVLGFETTGRALAEEPEVAKGLEVVAESLLADGYAPVSRAELERWVFGDDGTTADPADDPAVRLAAVKGTGAALGLTGWACSFGDRVFLALEVIRAEDGLPGKVVRGACHGVRALPDLLEELLADAGLLDTPLPARAGLPGTPPPAGDPAGGKAPAARPRSDPADPDERRLRTAFALDPLLRDLDFEAVRTGPWIVFVQRSGDLDAKTAAGEIGDLLAAVHEDFRARLGGPLDLPAPRDLGRADERVLRARVFTSRADFERYQQAIGAPLPPRAVSYYSIRDRWVTLLLDRLPGTDEDGAATWATSTLAHEAVHHLQHLYAKVLLDRETGEDVPWEDRRLRSSQFLLQEGLAEYYGGVRRGPDGRWLFGEPHRLRLREWKANRDRKLSEWTLRELLSIPGSAALAAHARRKGLADEPRLSSLFFAQAGAFVRFLHDFEDGRYRRPLTEAVRAELTGRSGYETFRAIFGKTDDDWSELEEEFLGWVDAELKELR